MWDGFVRFLKQSPPHMPSRQAGSRKVRFSEVVGVLTSGALTVHFAVGAGLHALLFALAVWTSRDSSELLLLLKLAAIYSLPCIVLFVGSLWCLVNFLRRRGMKWLLFVGVIAGGAALFAYDVTHRVLHVSTFGPPPGQVAINFTWWWTDCFTCLFQ
jgi:hypothetical protein